MRGVTKEQMIAEIKKWVEYAGKVDTEAYIDRDLNRMSEHTIRDILDTLVFLG